MHHKNETVHQTRNALTYFFTIGATLSIGFLSFAGMFVLSSSFIWCTTAFVLAAVYEGQVNKESISSAFRRIFDKDYLVKGLVKNRLESILNNDEYKNNYFIDEYKYYLKELATLKKISHPSGQEKNQIKVIEDTIKELQNTFFKQFKKPETATSKSQQDIAVREILSAINHDLQQEISRKKSLIRFSWILAIGGGISSGLATLSAIKMGVAAFTFLSVVPGGAIVALAAIAAIGYTLMIYQAISDMVQAYDGKWMDYFKQRKNSNGEKLESNIAYGLRCVATVGVIVLTIIATLAIAGTWWYAAKDGARLLNIADRTAAILRSITTSMMTFTTFIFTASNSVESVDKISRSPYHKLFSDTWKEIYWNTWKKETFSQFINPFRFIEKTLIYLGKTILFLGHIVSMGLMSDRSKWFGANLSIIANATTEGLADMNYLPKGTFSNAESCDDHAHGHGHENHNHDSILTDILFLPFAGLAFVCKFLAKGWDYICPKLPVAANTSNEAHLHDHSQCSVKHIHLPAASTPTTHSSHNASAKCASHPLAPPSVATSGIFRAPANTTTSESDTESSLKNVSAMQKTL